MRECRVCKLPVSKRILIEDKLVNGETYAQIARDTGLPEYSLSNHMKNHLSAEQLGDSKALALLDSDNQLNVLDGMIRLAKGAIREARQRGHIGMLLQGTERVTKLIELRDSYLKSHPQCEGEESINWSHVGNVLGVDGLYVLKLLLAPLNDDEMEIDDCAYVVQWSDGKLHVRPQSCIMNVKPESEEEEQSPMIRTRMTSPEPDECKLDEPEKSLAELTRESEPDYIRRRQRHEDRKARAIARGNWLPG